MSPETRRGDVFSSYRLFGPPMDLEKTKAECREEVERQILAAGYLPSEGKFKVRGYEDGVVTVEYHATADIPVNTDHTGGY